MSLNGIKFTTTFDPSASVIIDFAIATNSLASFLESLTPSIRATSSIVLLSFLERAFNASTSPFFNVSILYFVVGTNFFLKVSSTACTDHANAAGDNPRVANAVGSGATVETVIFDCAKPNIRLSAIVETALTTATGLSAGSPIPINTTLPHGGRAGLPTMRHTLLA